MSEVASPPSRDVALELVLGLNPEDASLSLAPSTHVQSLQPLMLDAAGVRVSVLGHYDEMPRTWDWENVLTSLEPGEELLYIIDYRPVAGAASFELTVILRFPPEGSIDGKELSRRNLRVRAVMGQLRRQAFPESSFQWLEPHEVRSVLGVRTAKCMAITGMPSPRTLEDDQREISREQVSRNYQSLNDVVEPLYDLGKPYRIAFVVQRVSSDELQEELGRKTWLYDRIHPLVEQSERAGSNWSEQQGMNWSTQRQEGGNSAHQTGTSETDNYVGGGAVLGAIARVGGGVVGGVVGAAVGVAAGPVGMAAGGAAGAAAGDIAGKALCNLLGLRESYSESSSSSVTTGRTWSTTRTSGGSSSTTRGESLDRTVQRVDSMLRLADGSLERCIASLHEAHGTGGYRWAAFTFAEEGHAQVVSRSLMGVLSGARTKDSPLVCVDVHAPDASPLESRSSAVQLVREAAPILSLPQVREGLLVPEAELPGLKLRQTVFLGRTVQQPTKRDGSDGELPDEMVSLGPDAFSTLGSDSGDGADITIAHGDLFKHMLVAGTTGSGKTVRAVEILNGLEAPELSVVVFETAKRTYRGWLRRPDRPLPLVYRLGSSESYPDAERFRPLRINPFYFELGTSLRRHISVLADALAELMPTESMIAPLMRRAVEDCYRLRKWDIERGLPINDAPLIWPTVVDFAFEVSRLASELNYGAEINANYRGALQSRADLFLDATFQDIFGHGGNASIDELFPPGRDAIVEVEDLPPSDVDIRAFVMTLLLARLRSVQGERPSVAPIVEPTVVEDSPPPPTAPTRVEQVQQTLRASGFAKAGTAVTRKLRKGAVSVDSAVESSPEQPIQSDPTLKSGGAVEGAAESPSSRECSQTGEEGSASRPTALLPDREWLLVVEEAHNVLDRSFEERRPSQESNAGRTLLRSVSRLLQEGRSMKIGIMVIDQSPSKLARDVIANTGTKVVMRLEDAAEMEEIGQSLGLEEDAWRKLGLLDTGEAIIKASYMDQPAKSSQYPKAKLSEKPSPEEREPSLAGRRPQYAALEHHWSRLTSGAGGNPSSHDRAWYQELALLSDGRLDLALFAGLRAQLRAHREGPTPPQLTGLTTALALASSSLDESPGISDLEQPVHRLWAHHAVEARRPQLAAAATLLASVLAPAPVWERDALEADGIQLATKLLADARLGTVEELEDIFFDAMDDLPSTRARDALTRLCQSHGQRPTFAVAVLLRPLAGVLHHQLARGESRTKIRLTVRRLVLGTLKRRASQHTRLSTEQAAELQQFFHAVGESLRLQVAFDVERTRRPNPSESVEVDDD